MKFLYLLSAIALAQEEKPVPEFQKTDISAPFLEQFENLLRWIPSQAKKHSDQPEEDQQLLQYRGLWEVEEALEQLIKGDKGLVLKTLAAHSAICSKFDKPIDNTGKTLVIQYEVKTQSGHDCGGAYVKLLTYQDKFDPAQFTDKTPYTIMFGPDKCGGNNKVHFIFRHENPINHDIEEKHLLAPPLMVSDKKTNLYTLIVNPDQTFKIKINNKVEKSGSLLKDFDPPVNPPAEIDDPEDKKPADWVDEAKIVDPDAKKPEDWDEDAPRQIVDEKATKPEDWLEDEQEFIPDPEAVKPEDWDDEEDGEWVAPTVANPKCLTNGCGPWEKPLIDNPDFKGKWIAPMIDNPAYKGEWAPRKIANPNFFEDKTPSNFNKIGAIGYELWSMNSDIMFDNIYVGHSEEDAEKLAEATWKIKYDLESSKEPEVPKEEAKDKIAELSNTAKEFFATFVEDLQAFVELAKTNPVGAVQAMPHVVGILALSFLVPTLLLSVLFGGKKEKKTEKKASKEEEKPSAKSTAVDSPKLKKRATKTD